LAVPHTPSAPDSLAAAVHAWHTPSHLLSQHIPSTQKPVLHSWFEAHGAALSSLEMQRLLLQYAVATQPESSAQEMAQLVP
jgi:hypothetical protein